MLRVLTANIRFAGPEDGIHAWENRQDDLVALLRRCDADVMCMQEPCDHQEAFLREQMPGYYAHGIPLVPENPAGRHVVIFFRHGRFILEAAGGFYLSETPHVPGSKSWGSAHVRLACTISLQDRESRRRLGVLNTHLDVAGPVVREKQSQLVREYAQALPEDRPQILCGDLNCSWQEPTIAQLLDGWQDTYHAVHGTHECGTTNHQFQGDAYDGDRQYRIDYIFFRGPLQARKCEIVKTDLGDGRFASDHHFLLSELEYII